MRIGRHLGLILAFSAPTLILGSNHNGAAMHPLHAPVLFETNQGQADPGVDYLCSGVNRWFSISAQSATLQLTSPLKIRFIDANRDAKHDGSNRKIAGNNYLIGDDPRGWLIDVPTYGGVRYRQVWPGVDVLYYCADERLEYDFIVAPHSDISKIQLAFEGADSLSLNPGGDLVMKVGESQVTQRRPTLFQTIDGRKVDVKGRYHIGLDRKIGILVDSYDAGHQLTIDPVILYSVPVLGPALASGNAIATDSAGTAYITGQSVAMGSPAQPQGYLLKVNRSGMAAAQATFFGSTDGPTVGNGIALDGSGNIYIAGTTTTHNYFSVFNDSTVAAPAGANAFVIKFDNSGGVRLYSSYIGGAKDESGTAIAVHGTGTAYITGSTASPTFPRQCSPRSLA